MLPARTLIKDIWRCTARASCFAMERISLHLPSHILCCPFMVLCGFRKCIVHLSCFCLSIKHTYILQMLNFPQRYGINKSCSVVSWAPQGPRNIYSEYWPEKNGLQILTEWTTDIQDRHICVSKKRNIFVKYRKLFIWKYPIKNTHSVWSFSVLMELTLDTNLEFFTSWIVRFSSFQVVYTDRINFVFPQLYIV